MKIKRFFAADIRQALRQVRQTLGADAVILSNKRVEGGVELVAAMDYDASHFAPDFVPTPKPSLNDPSQPEPSPDVLAEDQLTLHAARPAPQPAAQPAPAPAEQTARPARRGQSERRPQPKVEWSQEPALVAMRQEMQALRRLVELELSGLSWRDLGERRPQTRELLRRLMDLELGASLCRELADRVDDVADFDQAWRKALHHLTTELPIYRDNPLEYGGVVALVGPTGVGKTTTIAKLAARFALKHGHRQLALISADTYRIGAQEQLQNYARILDVPMRTVATADELNAALNNFLDKRLILIDTAGMGQRDVELGQKLAVLNAGSHRVTTLLTLSATTHRASLTQAIEAFAAARPKGCVVTKLDEAASLGGLFSALIESRLGLAWVTDGQRVPEDLHLARAQALVSRAVELAQPGEQGISDEYLALAFGGVSEHAHV